LQEGLKPAIESLAASAKELSQRQEEGIAEVLKKLLDEFSKGFHEKGAENKKVMESATAELSQTFEALNNTMARFLDKLAASQDDISGTNASLVAAAEVLVKRLSDAGDDQLEKMREELKLTMDQAKAVGEHLKVASDALSKGATDLRTSSSDLRQLGKSLQETSDGLGARLATLTTDVDRLTNEQIKANTGLVQLQQQFATLGVMLQDAATAVSDATQGAVEQTEGLREHQRELQQAMQQHIKDMQQQTAAFLNDYGQRVQGQTVERLNEWNKQTSEFSSTMVESTQAIAELVAEMESRRPLAA
jgi:ABC-type transporter Mla subunit MlaD